MKARVETPNTRVDPQNPPEPPKRTWRSANAFINFVQDFKKVAENLSQHRIFNVVA